MCKKKVLINVLPIPVYVFKIYTYFVNQYFWISGKLPFTLYLISIYSFNCKSLLIHFIQMF